jgi:hypothetical protein
MKMKVGILKSKVESLLNESYNKNTFKSELRNFDKLVLKNKNISKLFYLYDELSSKKGLTESIVDDYIHESITIYENVINKLKDSDLNNLRNWVGNVKTENLYENIDNLFSTGITTLESKLKSKKVIKETLTSKEVVKEDIIDIPISSMMKIANKTITSYIDSLNESDKKELFNLLSEDDETLNKTFEPLKESVLSKLTTLRRENTDYETGKRINESISKIESEKFNKLTYFKLKHLNENL